MTAGPEKRLSIREYCPEDLQQLHEIDQVCFPEDIAYSRSELRFYLRHKDSIARIAELDSLIVGFVVGRMEGELWAHVVTLDVVPRARRMGVGTALMRSLHEELELRNIFTVSLEVEAANTGACLFYQGLGYRWAETLKGYYAGRSDAYRMVRFVEGSKPVSGAG